MGQTSSGGKNSIFFVSGLTICVTIFILVGLVFLTQLSWSAKCPVNLSPDQNENTCTVEKYSQNILEMLR